VVDVVVHAGNLQVLSALRMDGLTSQEGHAEAVDAGWRPHRIVFFFWTSVFIM
jgi:hypothetical protein